MLKVYVCEDNLLEQRRIADIITKAICIEEHDMALSLATDNPHKLLASLKKLPSPGIYFLDVDLKSDINGIELAAQIRRLDPRGFIIFITTHEEMCPLTFQYKVEAMDYIAKNDFSHLAERIKECLKKADELYTAETNTVHKLFRFKIGSQIVTLPMNSVVYFEASQAPHRVIAHTLNGTAEFYGTIRELMEQADEHFLLSHRRSLVNTEHIASVDFAALQIHFQNGETCPASARLIKQFKDP